MRKYYAEIAHWGRDHTTVIQFDSKKERDNFVNDTDYTNNVYAYEAKERGYITYGQYISDN